MPNEYSRNHDNSLSLCPFFQGNQERSRLFLKNFKYIPDMLSKSRFNRRLHRIPENIWQWVFGILAHFFKDCHSSQEYVIDSFPVKVCHNIRIKRCRIYQDESYRGYCAAKKEYFYGLRIHLLVTAEGQPVEFILAAGSHNDALVLKEFEFDLPSGAIIYGDKGYNDYGFEELLLESLEVHLLPIRKKNSKRPLSGSTQYIQKKVRKVVETTGSLLNSLIPQKIHAVTPKGFELKVGLFVIAYAFSLL